MTSVLEDERKPDPVNLFGSALYILPQILRVFLFVCLLVLWMGRKVRHIDFVGNVVWYYPVALALHSCMVPIGVPASMRTRTQTVNHLCIF